MLVCKDLVKKYSDCMAVDGLSVTLEPGKIYALLGPNGSGKSTLMKMIVGLIKPTEGEITLDGVSICDATKAHITYMPTENYFYNYMNIKDVVKFFKDFYEDFKEDRFYDMLGKMDLDNYRDKIKNMSTGMLAKLKVALAMSRESRVILLDEPLNGIDIIAREHVMRAITGYVNQDKMVIVSSHLVDELETVVGGAIYMKKGRLVLAGDVEDIRANNDNKTLVDLYKEIYGGGAYNA